MMGVFDDAVRSEVEKVHPSLPPRWLEEFAQRVEDHVNEIPKVSDIPLVGPKLVGHGILTLTEHAPFGENIVRFVTNGHLSTAIVAHRPVIDKDGNPTDQRSLEVKVLDEGAE